MSPKRTLNWPGICQWDPPSQAFYPSIRTCINCWNLSNEHLQVRPKKKTTSGTRDWLEHQYLFNFSAQKISKDRFLFHSQKVERKLDRIPHLAHSISKSRQRELARLLRHNHGHFIWKGPWKMMELFTTENPTPQFLLPLRQHLSLPMRTHLAATFVLIISRLTQTTHTNTTWCRFNRNRRKVACLFASRRVGEPISENTNGQNEKKHSKFPATTDQFVSLRCPYTS